MGTYAIGGMNHIEFLESATTKKPLARTIASPNSKVVRQQASKSKVQVPSPGYPEHYEMTQAIAQKIWSGEAKDPKSRTQSNSGRRQTEKIVEFQFPSVRL